MVQERYR